MEPVKVTSEGAVTTLSLNRADRLNALTPALFAALSAAIDEALAGGARALVLTGEGRFFCSGADLGGGLPADLGEVIDAAYNPFVRKLAALPVPLVTALNGPAAGAGVSLALSGDIVVMADSAYLLLAFVNIGLVPDAGATWLVARSVGRARALEMALLGERLSAEEARAAGLVARIAPDADVLVQAQALAARLAAGPTLALGRIRRQIAYALDHDFEQVLAHERQNQSELGQTADFKEAVTAFAEKRTLRFTGT